MASEEPKQATTTIPEEQEVVVVTTDVPQVEETAPPAHGLDDGGEKVAPPKEEEEEETVVKFENATEVTSGGDSELPENEKKALSELKELMQNALLNHEFTTPPPSPPQETPAPAEEPPIVQPDEIPENPVEEEAKEETATDNEQEEETAKKLTVNEDGTKTVEAIEETVVVTPSPEERQQTADKELSAAAVYLPPAAAATVTQQQQQQEVSTASSLEELSIWGVPLFKDERTDTILQKFLRARDFKPEEAFAMIKSTINWRKQFKIDELIEEDLGCDELEKVVYMHGYSKEGNPVCYNVYGAFQNKELYQKTFSDEEKRERFLKWRVQFLEKSIRKLDFSPGGVSMIVQVNDLRNSPGPGKWELRQATKQALHLLQDNYPEFVAKQVFINVPWWYVVVNKMISPFLTQRTKSKFVVAGPSKSAETLFSYISPEQVPVQYGGFSKGEYGTKDGATQILLKPTSKEVVEFEVTEACELTWELRVLGWDVSYGAEFVPIDKDAYTVIIQKMKKIGPTQESIICNSFKTSQPGKVVLTIDNSSSKKKTLLYRLNSSKPSCE